MLRWHRQTAVVLLLSSAIAGCHTRLAHVDKRAAEPRGTAHDSASAPRHVPLSVATVDEFLLWVGSAPQEQRQLVRQTIASAADKPQVIDALIQRLFQFPVEDPGRHLMILATLGEMRSPRAIPSLSKFAWYDRPMMKAPTSTLIASSFDVGTTTADYQPLLQARAAEMLEYVGSRQADEESLAIVARHPSKAVRVAAIDAYLYNHGDSADAARQLREVTIPEDARYIGLVRRTAAVDPHEFEARVGDFYSRFPEEQAPAPMRLPGSRARPTDLPRERGSDVKP